MSEQEQALQAMWELNAARLLAGEAAVDPLLYHPEADDRRCLTLIAHLPPALTDRLAEVQGRLGPLAPVYAYPPGSLHFTIRGIYDYGHYQRVESDIAAMAPILRSLCTELPPLKVHFRGLGAHRSAVFAQGLYAQEWVPRLRKAIGEQLRRFHAAPLPTLDVAVDFVWVNLFRFASAAVSPLIMAIGEQYRTVDLGAHEFPTLELVEMDKYYRPASSCRFGLFHLGAPAGE